jgi:hypothetical protein
LPRSHGGGGGCAAAAQAAQPYVRVLDLCRELRELRLELRRADEGVLTLSLRVDRRLLLAREGRMRGAAGLGQGGRGPGWARGA